MKYKKPGVFLAGILATFLAFTLNLAFADADQILTATGLGPVRIGMTLTEAETALGTKLKSLDPNDGVSTEKCWLTQRADNSAPSTTYMIADGKIIRIDVWEDRNSEPSVATDKGIRIGASEAAISEKYGASLKISPHTHLGNDGNYIQILTPDGQYGLLFETAHGNVVNFRSGKVDAISLIETCL